MANTKKGFVTKLAIWLVIGYLLFLPLGKMARVSFVINDLLFSFNFLDILVLLAVPLFYLNKYKKPEISKFINAFLAIATFSTLLSFAFFPAGTVLMNSLYLVRLVAFYHFFMIVWNLRLEKEITRRFLVKSLVIVTLAMAVFGWLQYVWIPDLTSLKFLGWDDHLFRMVGTFLDPTFTSLFFVFGFFAALILYLDKKQKAYLLVSLFLLVSLLFTYTRASYLALFFGLFVVFIKMGKKSLAMLFLSVLTFGLVLVLLPRMASEGTLLERTQSIFAKFANYGQTVEIAKKYPVFGVGFNNLCPARIAMFGGDPSSHACPGADSSLLFVLATTGLVGFLVFLNLVLKIYKGIANDIYSQIFFACAVALFIHSMFVQSAFYTYVMGYMGILYASSLKVKE